MAQPKIKLKSFTKKKEEVKSKRLSREEAKEEKSALELKGLSPRQLIKAAPPIIKYNAEEVRFETIERKRTKSDLPGVLGKAISVGMLSRKKVYKVTIVGKNKKLKLSDKGQKVIVSCGCDFFKYSCEYALTHHGAAVIKYSNGEPPDFTNPGLHPVTCVAKGERVFTSRGAIKIEDVKVGDKVQTLEGFKPVLAAGKTGFKSIYELETDYGTVIKLSKGHLVLCAYEGDLVWVAVEKITTDHAIVSKFNSGFGKDEREGRSTFCNTTEELNTNFKNTFEATSSVKPAALKIKTRINIPTKHKHDLEKRHTAKKSKKVVPNWVFEASRESIANFIAEAYARDGYITGKVSCYETVSEKLAKQMQTLLMMFGVKSKIESGTSGRSGSLLYHVRTSSVLDTQRLVGLINLTKTTKPIKEIKNALSLGEKLWNINPYKIVQGLEYRKMQRKPGSFAKIREILKLVYSWLYKQQVKKARKNKPEDSLHEGIKVEEATMVLKKDLEKALTVLPSKEVGHLRVLLQDDVCVQKVVRIEKTKIKADVYDLTVKDAEHFVVNGVVVHNCKHLYSLLERVLSKGW